jgi:hypothetical protein
MLIVDAKNDLNVYKESADDECSGGEEKKETESSTGCCGNSSVKDDKACCDRSKADCCDKKDDCDRSCCGGGDVESIKDFVEKYKDLDFNEWVGKSDRVSEVFGGCFTNFGAPRVLQGLRCEAMS